MVKSQFTSKFPKVEENKSEDEETPKIKIILIDSEKGLLYIEPLVENLLKQDDPESCQVL